MSDAKDCCWGLDGWNMVGHTFILRYQITLWDRLWKHQPLEVKAFTQGFLRIMYSVFSWKQINAQWPNPYLIHSKAPAFSDVPSTSSKFHLLETVTVQLHLSNVCKKLLLPSTKPLRLKHKSQPVSAQQTLCHCSLLPNVSEFVSSVLPWIMMWNFRWHFSSLRLWTSLTSSVSFTLISSQSPTLRVARWTCFNVSVSLLPWQRSMFDILTRKMSIDSVFSLRWQRDWSIRGRPAIHDQPACSAKLATKCTQHTTALLLVYPI